MTDKDKTERFRCSEAELAIIIAAAKASDMTRSAWLRTTALREARKVLEKVKGQKE